MSFTPVSFWSRILQAERGQGNGIDDPPGVPDNVKKTIRLGQTLHLLEWLYDIYETGVPPRDQPRSQLIAESRNQRMKTWNRNQQLKSMIKEIDETTPAGEYAWLKGAGFLLDGAYKPGLRRMSDLDLLIRKEDIKAWTGCFEELGFSAHRSPEWIRSPNFHQSVSSTRFYGEPRGQTVILDVHWHLVDFPARRRVERWDFSMDPIFDRMKDHRLAPAHRLLYVTDHAFSHSFRRWKWFLDIKWILKHRPVDPDVFRKESRRWEITPFLELAEKTHEQITGDELFPAALRESIDSGELDEAVKRRFIERSASVESEVGDYLKICFKLLDSIRERMNFLRAIAWPPVEGIPNMTAPINGVGALFLYLKRTVKVCFRGLKIFTRV